MTTYNHKQELATRAYSSVIQICSQQEQEVCLKPNVPISNFDLVTYFLLSDCEMRHEVMTESAPDEDFLKRSLESDIDVAAQEENLRSSSHSYASLHLRQQILNNEENPKSKDDTSETMYYATEVGGVLSISGSASETTASTTTTTKTATSMGQEEVSLTDRNQLKRPMESDIDHTKELNSALMSENDNEEEKPCNGIGSGSDPIATDKESNKPGQIQKVIISKASSSPRKDAVFSPKNNQFPAKNDQYLPDSTDDHAGSAKRDESVVVPDNMKASKSLNKGLVETVTPGSNPSKCVQESTHQIDENRTFSSSFETSINYRNAADKDRREDDENKRRMDQSFKKKRTSQYSSNDKSQNMSSEFPPSSYHDSSWDQNKDNLGASNANDGSWAHKASDYRYGSEGLSHDAYYQGEDMFYNNAHKRQRVYPSNKNDHKKVRSYSFPSDHPAPPSHTNSDPLQEEPMDSWQAFMAQKDRDDEHRARSSSWSPQGVSSKASSYSASSVVPPRQPYQHTARPPSSSYSQSHQQGHYYDPLYDPARSSRVHRESKEGGNDRSMNAPSSNPYHRHSAHTDDVSGINGTAPHHHYQYNHFEPLPQETYHHSYESQHAEGSTNGDQFYPPPPSEHQNSWPMYPPVPPLSEATFLPDDGEAMFPTAMESGSRAGSESSRSVRQHQKRGKTSSRSRNVSSYYPPPYPYDGSKQYPGHYSAHHHQQYGHPASRPTSSSAVTRPSSNASKPVSQSMCHPVNENQQFPMQPYYNREILALSTDEDENWLSEFLCFVRSQCVEVFSATKDDVASRMNSKKVLLNQVGIRCRFCAHIPHRERTGRSSSFPSSISRIYQSLTMMLRDHFTKCHVMPRQMKERYLCLKANASQGATDSKKYWVESAHNLGLVDTEEGIRFAREVLPNTDEVNADQHQLQLQHHSSSQC